MAIRKYARIIIYEGEEEWLNKTLLKSLNLGVNCITKNKTITVLDKTILTKNAPDAEENNDRINIFFKNIDEDDKNE